jgi:hypothetical protein
VTSASDLSIYFIIHDSIYTAYNINDGIHVHFVCREIERPLKPYVNKGEDTYLTLEILSAILDSLSESGKVLI